MSEREATGEATGAAYYGMIGLGIAMWYYQHARHVFKAFLVCLFWPAYLIYRVLMWVSGLP